MKLYSQLPEKREYKRNTEFSYHCRRKTGTIPADSKFDITSILQYTVPSLGPSAGQTSNTGQTLRGRQVLVLIDGVPQSTPLRNGGRDIRVIDPLQ